MWLHLFVNCITEMQTWIYNPVRKECKMTLLIHSQISMASSLKSGNRCFSAHTSYIKLLSHAGILGEGVTKQNDRHFADDILKLDFLDDVHCILIQISSTFAPSGPIDNKSSSVQVMTILPKIWLRPQQISQPQDTYLTCPMPYESVLRFTGSGSMAGLVQRY